MRPNFAYMYSRQQNEHMLKFISNVKKTYDLVVEIVENLIPLPSMVCL